VDEARRNGGGGGFAEESGQIGGHTGKEVRVPRAGRRGGFAPVSPGGFIEPHTAWHGVPATVLYAMYQNAADPLLSPRPSRYRRRRCRRSRTAIVTLRGNILHFKAARALTESAYSKRAGCAHPPRDDLHQHEVQWTERKLPLMPFRHGRWRCDSKKAIYIQISRGFRPMKPKRHKVDISVGIIPLARRYRRCGTADSRG